MKCNRVSLLVEEYLSYKRNLGFQLIAEAVYLRAFAKYTVDIEYEGHLTREIVFRWCESGDNPSLITKGRRYEPLYSLAMYASAYDPESQMLPRLPYGNPHKRVMPHIYSEDETCKLMERCGKLYSPDGIRALTVKTAIGLLWATGLRTSELVKLNNTDVDFNKNLLYIRSSKFNKDRLIPLTQDVAEKLYEYKTYIDTKFPGRPENAIFFVTTGGIPLNSRALEYAFQKIRDCIDVSDSGYTKARLYDFRHTFASRTVARWYKCGEDANAKLFLLSTYLGHIHPEDTYWYLTATPELLSLSAQKYEQFFGGVEDD